MRTWILLLLASLVMLVSHPATAQTEADKATARELAKEAQKALEAKDYGAAVDKFTRAEKLFHAPTLVLGRARAYVGLEKYVEAMESYNAVIREKLPNGASDAFTQAKVDAAKEIEGLDAKIAWVTLTVNGPSSPEVSLDGTAVPEASLGVRRALNPGDHELTGGGEGFGDGSVRFSVGAGEEKDVVLELEPSTATVPPPPPGGDDGGNGLYTILGWTGVGVGGAGILVGAITGSLAWVKRNEVVSECDDESRCPPEQTDNIKSFQVMGNVSTVSFVVGGVFAAGGTLLLILAPSDDVEAEIGLGRVGVTVRF
jgi:hypothetical protein